MCLAALDKAVAETALSNAADKDAFASLINATLSNGDLRDLWQANAERQQRPARQFPGQD
jgi:hypothetical protein